MEALLATSVRIKVPFRLALQGSLIAMTLMIFRIRLTKKMVGHVVVEAAAVSETRCVLGIPSVEI